VDMLLEVGAIEPHLFVISVNMTSVHHSQPHSVNALLASRDNPGTPYLRSGIYFVQPPSSLDDDPRVFVIYWPEETTWDDNAVSSVKRNRVTFMRCYRKSSH